MEHNEPRVATSLSDEGDVWLQDPANVHKEGMKLDKKLGKLWTKAQKTGFTGNISLVR